MKQKHPRLDAFVSLAWYDTLLRFITNFIAKTSEILLAAGLVVSSANFLTDGAILGTTTTASQAWAWAQALAIDSSLAISFYHVLFCVKQRDWIKCALYSLLTGLLALVAGTITNIDIFSHAIHASLNHSMSVMGLNIAVLSSLRSVAVVGFVLMSRLRDVSFKNLATQEPGTLLSQNEPEPADQPAQASHSKEPGAEVAHFTVEDVARLLQILAYQNRAAQTHIMVEPKEEQNGSPFTKGDPQHLLGRAREPMEPGAQSHKPGSEPSLLEPREDTAAREKASVAPQRHSIMALEPEPPRREQSQQMPDLHPMHQGQTQKSREERLELAYQELIAEGHKVSGRALAERAHMHRSLCTKWLRIRQQIQSSSKTNNHTEGAPDPDDSDPLNQEELPS